MSSSSSGSGNSRIHPLGTIEQILIRISKTTLSHHVEIGSNEVEIRAGDCIAGISIVDEPKRRADGIQHGYDAADSHGIVGKGFDEAGNGSAEVLPVDCYSNEIHIGR